MLESGIALASLLGTALLAQAVEKVNGPLAADPTQGGGQVTSFELGTGGARVLLAGDLEVDGHGELWSVPFAGGPLARLSAFTRPENELEIAVRPVPGRRLVVFWTDPDTDRVRELFVVPDDGRTPPVRLHPALTSGQNTGQDFRLTSDAVVFRGDLDGDGDFELFRAPLDASTPPLLLSGTLVAGGSLGFSEFQDGILELTPAGDRAVYLADARIDGRTELFSVPSDGSAPPLRLSANLVTGGQVSQFLITPDGTRVLYAADQELVGRLELYSVPIVGGSVTRVSATPVPGGSLRFQSLAIGAGGTRVVYLADARVDGTLELFSAPVDGSAAPTPLNPTLVAGGLVTTYRLSADGAHVVYQADQTVNDRYELWVAPTGGGAAAAPLLGPAFAGPVEQTLLDVSSTHVLCYADGNGDGQTDLYLARLDGSQPPLLLTRAPYAFSSSVAKLSPDGSRAWFLERDAQVRGQLFGVPADGSQAPVRLSPPLPPGGKVILPRFREDGALAFLCDAHALGQFSAWSQRGDGARELTPLLPPAPSVGDVSAYAWSPGGTHILYGADRFSDRAACVTSVSLRAGTESFTTPRQGTVFSILFPPGGERFACTIHDVGDFFPFPSSTSLYAGPLDDAAQAVHVVGSTSIGRVVFPDAERAVVPLSSSGYRIDPEGSLVLARLDGTAPVRELSPPLGRPSGVTSAGLAPRAGRVVFGAFDFSGAGPSGLYSARLDVDQPAERIDLAAHPSPFLYSLHVRPSDELTLFVSDLAAFFQYELWAVPADGSSAPRRLHAPLPAGTQVSPEFRVSPDGEHVVFRSDARQAGAFELFVTRVSDGTTLPLSGALVAGGDILAGAEGEANFWISPDGARVVYLADQAVDEVVEYWSVPLDASAPPVRLHAPLSGALDAVPAAHVSPDGARVVLPLELGVDGQVELVVAPIDGSAPPTVLSAPFPPGGGLKTTSSLGTWQSLELAPGGRHAFYLAEQDQDGVVELYSVPLDGSAPPLRWNAPLVSGGNVVSFALRPTPGAVLYLADQDEDETFELYLASFPGAPPPRAGSGAPTRSTSVTLPE